MKRVLLLLFILSCSLLAQEQVIDVVIPDSIQSKTYFQLYERFYENYKAHPNRADVYANAYLGKAKIENKEIAIAHRYLMLSNLYQDKALCLVYTDSLIQATQDLKNKGILTRGYLLKGDYFLRKGLLQKAWSNYKDANRVLEQNRNSNTIYTHNRSIGLLKSRLGMHEAALKIFKDCYQYALQEDLDSQFNDMAMIVNEFMSLKVLDSVSYYNNKGIQESLGSQRSHQYNLFIQSVGVAKYYKKQYQQSADSLSKALGYFEKNNEDFEALVSHLYLGLVSSKMRQNEKSITYLKKMDTLAWDKVYVFPDMRKGYKLLIDYLEKQGDVEQRDFYTQRLSEIDMVLKNNISDSLKQSVKKYAVPVILLKKDKKNTSLIEGINTGRLIIAIEGFFLIIFVGIIIYLYKDRRRYQKSFRAVVSHTNKSTEAEATLKVEGEGEQQLSDLNISPESIQRILEGIAVFESKKRFLDKKYSLTVFAKELKTNSTYLSKIINIYKEKNFSNYLHDLRIGYAIECLRDDEKFRLYSIKGISEEVGFNTSESFAKAFHKKTGMYPSSFIKSLKSA